MSVSTSDSTLKRNKRPLEELFNDDEDSDNNNNNNSNNNSETIAVIEPKVSNTFISTKRLQHERSVEGYDRSNTASPIKRSSLARTAPSTNTTQEIATINTTSTTSTTTSDVQSSNNDTSRDAFWEELQNNDKTIYYSSKGGNSTSHDINTDGINKHKHKHVDTEERPSVASQQLPCLPILTPYLDVPHPTFEMLESERDGYERSLGGNNSLFRRYWSSRRGIVDAVTYRQRDPLIEPSIKMLTSNEQSQERLRDFDGQTPLKWLYEEQNLPLPSTAVLSSMNSGSSYEQQGRPNYRYRGRERGGGGAGSRRGNWRGKSNMNVE
ncbi:hypothetical protein BDF19DRAFT_413265 [Syncephalis fuscata]|nr:hypothetical protein BDF19DRAFT_413265 [Syncephalis fuscata]